MTGFEYLAVYEHSRYKEFTDSLRYGLQRTKIQP